MVTTINTCAFTEVKDIINHMETRVYNKIPKEVIELIEENENKEYKPNIDYSKNINNQILLEDTKIILALIYREFVCSKEKREELIRREQIKISKIEEEKRKKYNPNELFKKKEIEAKKQETTEDTRMTLYKKSIFTRIINKIKNIFKIGAK